MLNADAIQKIKEMSQSEVVEVEGMSFHKTSSGLSAIRFPAVPTLEVFSLTQLVSFVKAWFLEEASEGKMTGSPLIINVDSPDRVTVRSQIRPDLSRDTIAEASMEEIHETFPFGTKLSQEDFVIKLMTQFADDEERTAIAQTVSTVRAEKIQEGADDGVSQVVSSKAGVHLTSQKEVKKFWRLKTYKTFPEVEQPTIPYMLRLHQRAEELPQFALYVCDGGKWKIDTTLAVREWLTNQLKTEMGEKFGTDVVVL